MFDAKLCRINRFAVQLVQTHTFSLSLSLFSSPHHKHTTSPHSPTPSSSLPLAASPPWTYQTRIRQIITKKMASALIYFLPLNWVLISSCHTQSQGRVFVLTGKRVSSVSLMRNNMPHLAHLLPRGYIFGHPARVHGRQNCTQCLKPLFLETALNTDQTRWRNAKKGCCRLSWISNTLIVG